MTEVDYTERPVVVGDVWEGVLEFRTVRVVSTEAPDGAVRFSEVGQTDTWLPLAEFRERFTRRGR